MHARMRIAACMAHVHMGSCAVPHAACNKSRQRPQMLTPLHGMTPVRLSPPRTWSFAMISTRSAGEGKARAGWCSVSEAGWDARLMRYLPCVCPAPPLTILPDAHARVRGAEVDANGCGGGGTQRRVHVRQGKIRTSWKAALGRPPQATPGHSTGCRGSGHDACGTTRAVQERQRAMHPRRARKKAAIAIRPPPIAASPERHRLPTPFAPVVWWPQ